MYKRIFFLPVDTFHAKQKPSKFHHNGIINFLEWDAHETFHSYNGAGTRLWI